MTDISEELPYGFCEYHGNWPCDWHKIYKTKGLDWAFLFNDGVHCLECSRKAYDDGVICTDDNGHPIQKRVSQHTNMYTLLRDHSAPTSKAKDQVRWLRLVGHQLMFIDDQAGALPLCSTIKQEVDCPGCGITITTSTPWMEELLLDNGDGTSSRRVDIRVNNT